MSMYKTIQVFEYETLRVGTNGFQQEHFDLLVKFTEYHLSQYYSIGNKSVTFSSHVGVLQVSGLTIEILPKAGRVSNKQLWRDVLLQMLKMSGILKMRVVSKANLRMSSGSLFDVYIDVFLEHCRKIMTVGLIRQYLLRSANRNVLRGRLLFSEQLKHNMIHRERFYTTSQDYSRDNVFNQILFKALNIVCKVASSSILRKEASLLCQQMEGLSDMEFATDNFSRLKYDRTSDRYRDAINLAELIILNYLPDLRGGNRSVLALLFPMEFLFETYVASMLKRAAHEMSCRISTQHSKRFWRNDQGGFRKLRPDIVIDWTDATGPRRMVLDTKWKLPQGGMPANSDLKQMFVYNEYFMAESSNLVYPATETQGISFGHFVKEEHGRCSMWYVRILDQNQGILNVALGREMLQVLNTEGVVHE